MNPQQLLVEPEPREEAATEWSQLPPSLIPSAIARTDVSQHFSLLEGGETLGGFPMGTDLQHTCQPMSMMTPRPYQQPEEIVGHSQVQEPDLPEEVQRELAEAEFRHTATRWEILERANALSATPHPQATTASYSESVTDETVTGYSGVFDRASLPVDPQRILNHFPTPNNSSSVYRLGPDVWPGLQIPQTTVYPHIFEHRAQRSRCLGITIPDAQNYDQSAPYHATCGQQPAIDLMPPTTSQQNTMIPVLRTNDQENYGSFLEAPTGRRHTQQLFLMQGVGSVPVNASEMSMYTTIDSFYDTTAPSAGLSWNGNIDPSANHPLSMRMLELPSLPAIDQSSTTNLVASSAMIPPGPSQAMTVAAKTCERPVTLVKRKLSVSGSADDIRAPPSCSLDNIYFHTNPEADRQRQKAQPKRRKVTKKASWSCFGCRLSKRRCEPSTNGLCLRCKDILNKYSYRTAIPKFTCDVRTRFSEISIFTNILPTEWYNEKRCTNLAQSLSHSFEIEWDDSFPPVFIEYSTKLPPGAVPHVAYRLLRRLRNFLDIIEPLHIRQLFSLSQDSSLAIFWSYSFSTIRWKRAILFHWPELEEALEFHEELHRSLHLSLLAKLDRMLSFGYHINTAVLSNAAVFLNVWYEGLSAMEDSPMIDISAKEHLESSLSHHILHVYRRIFPTTPVMKKSEWANLETITVFFNMFPHTSKLLPPCSQVSRVGFFARHLLRAHKIASGSEEKLSWEMGVVPSQKSSERSERPYSALNAYVPARFLAVLGMNTKTLEPETISSIMKPVEASIKEFFTVQEQLDVHEELLDMSPWLLSIGLRSMLDESAIRNYTGSQRSGIMSSIIVGSLGLCRLCTAVTRVAAQVGTIEGFGSPADTMIADGILQRLLIGWFTSDRNDCYIPP